MNNKYNISSYADLDREEMRVKKRINKQEEQIKLKLKTLPEEIIKTGVSKIISGIVSGDIFKTTVSVIKTIKSTFSEIKNEESNTTGVFNMIKNLVKDNLSK